MIGNRWVHPKSGETRYYIDVEKAAQFGGLEIDRYNTGNICWSALDGETISHAKAGRILNRVEKVWYTEDGQVHFKFNPCGSDDHDAFWQKVKESIEKALAEEEI